MEVEQVRDVRDRYLFLLGCRVGIGVIRVVLRSDMFVVGMLIARMCIMAEFGALG